MNARLAVAALLIGCWVWSRPLAVHGAVVILSNRTDREIRFSVLPPEGKAQEYSLASGDLLPLRVLGPIEIAFGATASRRQYRLDPDSAYYFANFPDGLNLQEIRLGGVPAPSVPNPHPAAAEPMATVRIPVKLLVDEEEPSNQRTWEERLRRRFAAASDILEKHCHVRFEVVAVGTWRSDNILTDFEDLLRDFERKVESEPARVAVGFTSQQCVPRGRSHLGGTRGALHSHILIREWTPRTEPERLEVLLHELGHHLGAAHSPEADSVMRPQLGDGKAIVRRFRIGFDPPNALAMCLFAEEIRTHSLKNLRQLRPTTKARLRQIYTELARALPDDPVAAKYVELFREVQLTTPSGAPVRGSALLEGARSVLAALVQAAERNQRLPLTTDRTGKQPSRLTGDRLTEHYYREAALAARRLPAEHAAAAYLLAMGIGLDSTDLFRKTPATGEVCRLVESDVERRRRLEVLGGPTMHSRPDLTMHFAVSGALTVLLGARGAEAAGILKEQLDAHGGSGFSLADLCADLAGIAFATRLSESETRLAPLATSFRVADYLPDPTGLREGLSQERFRQEYGSVSDERFRAAQLALWKRIRALPGYQER